MARVRAGFADAEMLEQINAEMVEDYEAIKRSEH